MSVAAAFNALPRWALCSTFVPFGQAYFKRQSVIPPKFAVALGTKRVFSEPNPTKPGYYPAVFAPGWRQILAAGGRRAIRAFHPRCDSCRPCRVGDSRAVLHLCWIYGATPANRPVRRMTIRVLCPGRARCGDIHVSNPHGRTTYRCPMRDTRRVPSVQRSNRKGIILWRHLSSRCSS